MLSDTSRELRPLQFLSLPEASTSAHLGAKHAGKGSKPAHSTLSAAQTACLALAMGLMLGGGMCNKRLSEASHFPEE